MTLGQLVPAVDPVVRPAVGNGRRDPRLEGGRPARVVAAETGPDQTDSRRVDFVSSLQVIDGRGHRYLVVVAYRQLGADLALAGAIEAEYGHAPAEQRSPPAMTLLFGRVETGKENNERGGTATRRDREEPGEVGLRERDADLLDRGLHEREDTVMTLDHLGQTVSVGLLVVDREEVGQVITSRRARGTTTPRRCGAPLPRPARPSPRALGRSSSIPVPSRTRCRFCRPWPSGRQGRSPWRKRAAQMSRTSWTSGSGWWMVRVVAGSTLTGGPPLARPSAPPAQPRRSASTTRERHEPRRGL